MSYDSYQILLDEPASLPGLGFSAYAVGLADIIATSQPRFTIGIFGGWGSGKTTLMHAIEAQLETRPEVVTLWFSAWRFEREDNMIVPLVDVLREALSRLAENDLEPARRAKARTAADRIARAGRALLAGIKVRAAIPGLDVELEAGKVIEAFGRGSETAPADVPLSFYHAGFVMLDDAINTFVGHGADRIVIFVDDLDRCRLRDLVGSPNRLAVHSCTRTWRELSASMLRAKERLTAYPDVGVREIGFGLRKGVLATRIRLAVVTPDIVRRVVELAHPEEVYVDPVGTDR